MKSLGSKLIFMLRLLVIVSTLGLTQCPGTVYVSPENEGYWGGYPYGWGEYDEDFDDGFEGDEDFGGFEGGEEGEEGGEGDRD